MRTMSWAPSVLMTVLLAACGGGGGGAGQPAVPSSPVAVAITEASAKVVGASALEAVQGGASAQSAVGLVGVQTQVSASSATGPALLWTVRAARALAKSNVSSGAATGVAVNETVSCSGGGTAQVQGSVADPNMLTAGDLLTLVASNCRETEAGVTSTMNGAITLRFNRVSETTSGFQANITVTATTFTVQSGSTAVTFIGQQTLDLNETTTSTTLAISGVSATTTISTNSGTRTTTWKNFSQRYTLSAGSATSEVSGTLESDSTKLGATGGSFAVTTPTALSWNVSTGVVSSGAMKVVGASNSQMLMTFSATGVVIDVDANGDGTYEKTLTSTVSELTSLL